MKLISSSAVLLTIIKISYLDHIDGFLRTPFSRNIRLHMSEVEDEKIVPLSANAEILAPKALAALQTWICDEPFEDIVPKHGVALAVAELQKNDQFWDANKNLYEKWWAQFEETSREETRPLKDILGSEAVNSLLAAVEDADVYEPATVRAFLQNPAFETMIGNILYEGIFEFIKRVDIIGNIVNGLPIIGPIRQTIMNEFKKQLDKTLGGQITTFLKSFSRIGVERMIEFVLSPSNRKSLQTANKNVVASLLERPFASIVPDKAMTLLMRDRLWLFLRESPTDETKTIVDLIYEQIGSTKIIDFTDAAELLDAMPTARRIMQRNIGRFLDTEDGKGLLQDMAIVTMK
jgi:hypothetical protein|mmetsp:Transcript_9485/g.9276  ORF Transcript_9485/g.9276 Transcript_9485/m.9276 type:complete len:348 (-) Transcript_9485:485-1528(-)|eukprot:CAMPEP_0119045688 /NCGR_PEP_ID=MMETSP1177-20130426/41951_1 /TAXON_ID=2985 /ORGANISM="Ochromonas sp, Strain CCMP1899" /LENGTH=347 /DNA_ID=CAMNT_0007017913 /DNA_START=75 /DNA_END=1118 /DNA_ORIENTATION=-